MILPGMGVISDLIACFSRRNIFGYKFIAFSSLAIAFLGFLVWGHHMYTSGQSELSSVIFSFLTFMVAIPSAIKVFNWTTTMYKGSISLETPMLYAMAFIFLFAIGGLTGITLGALSVDIHLHDTYYVVAHFHYVMIGGAVIAFLGGIHFWWPKMFGRMYNNFWSVVAFVFVFVGFNLTFMTQFFLGSKGMPRRYHDYLPEFAQLNGFSSVGALIQGIGYTIILINMIVSLKRGKPAGPNPWGARTLEWEHTTSPPDEHNFDGVPAITHDPYDFRAPK